MDGFAASSGVRSGPVVDQGWFAWSLAQAAPAVPGGPVGGSAAAASGAPAGAPGVPGVGTTADPNQPAPGATPGQRGGGPPGFDFLLIMMLILVGMIIFTSIAGRKQRKQRESMLASLKRSDRVVTSSGIIGTIAELYDHELVLRVDETSNTRIRMQRSAVQGVLREGAGGAASSVEGKPSTEAAATR